MKITDQDNKMFKTRCYLGRCASCSKEARKTKNYINIKGEHPKPNSVIYYDKIVLKKEELNNNNWLYMSNETQIQKENQLLFMYEFESWVPVFD